MKLPPTPRVRRTSRGKWVILWAVAVVVIALSVAGCRGDVGKQPKEGVRPVASQNAPRILYPIFVDGKVGFADKTGKIHIQPRFDQALEFREGLAPVRTGRAWGYIGTGGKVVIQPQFMAADCFSEGLARVTLALPPKGKFKTGPIHLAYINRTGKVITNIEFDETKPFRWGLAPVRIKDKWGCIDKTGAVVIAPQYDEMSEFDEGLARVGIRRLLHGTVVRGDPEATARYGKKNYMYYGFIDTRGKVVIKPQFAYVPEWFVDGLAPAQAWHRVSRRMPTTQATHEWLRSTDLGYIDKSGRWAIKPQFFAGWPFSEGLAAVSNGNHVGYIDKSGKIVLEAKYGGGRSFSGGLAAVNIGGYWEHWTGFTIGGEWGYIDKRGKVVVEPRFFSASDFSQGLAAVGVLTDDGYKVGFIDKRGKFTVPPRFDGAGDYSTKSLAEISIGGKYYMVNKAGEVVFQTRE